jgi:hypothetical protein
MKQKEDSALVALLEGLKASFLATPRKTMGEFFLADEKVKKNREGVMTPSNWQPFYLKNFRDNLFYGTNENYVEHVIQYFYKNTDENFAVKLNEKVIHYEKVQCLLGNETTKGAPLVSMAAMRSSAALIANILSRPPFDGTGMKIVLSKDDPRFSQGEYRVYFEFPLRTLLIEGQPQHPSMADAVLIKSDQVGNVDALIIVESKLLEYFYGKPEEAKKSYLFADNYYPELRGNLATSFAELFKNVNESIAKGQIKFDAVQLLHHSLGYLNERLCQGGSFSQSTSLPLGNESKLNFGSLKKVTMVNAVWNPESKDADHATDPKEETVRAIWEGERSDQQRQVIGEKLTKILRSAEPNGPSFDFVFLPALEFADLFEQNDDLHNYLKRYKR